LRAAAENARLNALDRRLRLVRGGPDAVTGTWPLVVANLLAAPLVELAPVLVRRVGHHGRLVLSGIPPSLEPDVDRAYRRLGMYPVRAQSRAGWSALVLQGVLVTHGWRGAPACAPQRGPRALVSGTAGIIEPEHAQGDAEHIVIPVP